MDPVSMAIITAVMTGVATGATDVGKKAIVDAYNGLKALLIQKFGAGSEVVESVAYLEEKPGAAAREAGVVAGAKAVNADKDQEVLAAAQALLDALKKIPEGQQALSKYQINAKDSQIGNVGDRANIQGGINFGAKPANTKPDDK
jgi:hypothetical protein